MTNKKKSVATDKKCILGSFLKYALAIVCIVTTSLLFYGFTPLANEDASLTAITIIDGQSAYEIETKGQTVGDALYAANITLGENDQVSKGITEIIRNGETINIRREKKFNLNTSGKTYKIKSHAETVGEALLADGFQVGKYDEVVPDVNTPLTNGMTVLVNRVYVDVYEVEKEIPYTTKTIENKNKTTDYRKVTQEGEAGISVRTYKKVSKEGAGVTVTLIGEHVEKEPVERIVEVGTAKATSLTPGKTTDGVPHAAIPTIAQKNSKTIIDGNTAVTAYGTFTFSKVLNCKATAYEGSSASNGKWAGKTATGRAPVFGVVAVDPSVIPLNSKLYIESADGGKSWIYGFAVAGDTGGAIKGNKIDLCYNTLSQCYQFGRRDAVVYVLN